MNIYIYSDESGVFDYVHNNTFVFGGIIMLGASEKETWSRKYSKAEKTIRNSNKKYTNGMELKATNISNKEKGKLFRSLNNCYKFGVVINQNYVIRSIFDDKKSKQRYLDYAYKIAVKRALQDLINKSIINPNDVERIYFYVDEHTTATNGCYELQMCLEQELRNGTYNYTYSKFFPPLFTKMKDLKVKYCNSSTKLLVRAADIVANRIYYMARSNKDFSNIRNLHITYLP